MTDVQILPIHDDKLNGFEIRPKIGTLALPAKDKELYNLHAKMHVFVLFCFFF